MAADINASYSCFKGNAKCSQLLRTQKFSLPHNYLFLCLQFFTCLAQLSFLGNPFPFALECLQPSKGQKYLSAPGMSSGCMSAIWRSRSLRYRKPSDLHEGLGHLKGRVCDFLWTFRSQTRANVFWHSGQVGLLTVADGSAIGWVSGWWGEFGAIG